MQSLKNIFINGGMILVLLLGLTISATAAPTFEETKLLAEQGDSLSQAYLGTLYSDGKGVRQDYSKALKWFKKSADQNNEPAQSQMGIIYEFGYGVRQNKTIAKEWYGKSCDNGYQGSCDRYRILNEQGY